MKQTLQLLKAKEDNDVDYQAKLAAWSKSELALCVQKYTPDAKVAYEKVALEENTA